MKFLFPALFYMALILTASATDIRFYVGTTTDQSTSKGIYVGTLDTATGKLGELRLAATVMNPNFLALAPGNKFLYAAISTYNASAVVAFAPQDDGTLKLLNEKPAGGNGTCHVAVDATGHDVLIANFNTGNVACFQTGADGSLGDRTALVAFMGSGPNPTRQKKAYAHSVYFDPENKFVYSCDLGSDSIWTLAFDAAQGTLVPTDPPAAKVPPGSGPRHLAFSPDGKIVYVLSEMGQTISSFVRDAATARLTPLETVSSVAPGTPSENVTAAEIFCHPSGKWLYVSNRGCDTLCVFSIAADGKLTFIQSVPSIVNFPRSFALDPSGQWIIAAGQKDNRIAVLKIDSATGLLSATDQTAPVGNPVCILFALPK